MPSFVLLNQDTTQPSHHNIYLSHRNIHIHIYGQLNHIYLSEHNIDIIIILIFIFIFMDN